MQKINTIKAIKNWVEFEKSRGKTIALVPTMGGLHAGHLALVDLAKNRADKVVVSIFVNPKQFAKNEDFDSYPRTLAKDLEALKIKKVDVVFTPNATQIYPKDMVFNQAKFSRYAYLFEILCGQTRPHFFYGSIQIVTRLFESVCPDMAVFGRKDYQQLKIIKKFTSGVKILEMPTVREDNGLAMSTRNTYLSDSERCVAALLYQTLQQLAAGKLNKNQAYQVLEKSFKVDYLEILDGDTLIKINDNTQKIAILCAVFLGKNRLIDNITYRLSAKVFD